MDKVEYSPWADDEVTNANEILRVANQISSATQRLKTYRKNGPRIDFEVLFLNIESTLHHWAADTLVGIEKSPRTEKAFQAFFESLLSFLLACQRADHPFLQKFAEGALYRGTLYRYLGHRTPDNCKERVIPRYGNIYVSWSKKEQNSYIESKLYGVMTLMTCNVSEPYYGIDLTAFGESRPGEEEVVFPTLEDTIVCVEYLREEENDASEERCASLTFCERDEEVTNYGKS